MSAAAVSELLRACLDTGNTAAWGEFVRVYQRLIASMVLRALRQYTNLTAELVDDLVQTVFLRLVRDDCALLRHFEPEREGSFEKYLKQVSVSVVLDHYRKEKAGKRSGDRLAVPLEDLIETMKADGANVEQEVLINQVFVAAGVETRDSPTGARDRAIFAMRFRQGLTCIEIAKVKGFNLTPEGVESVLHRLTSSVRKRVRVAKGNSDDPPLIEKKVGA